MKKKRKLRLLSIVLCLILSIPHFPARASEYEVAQNRTLVVDGNTYTLKTLYYAYENNIYVSVRDVACALRSSSKAFQVEVTKNKIQLTTGVSYEALEGDNTPWTRDFMDEALDVVLKRNEFLVNENNLRYYTLITQNEANQYDGFVMLVDLAMILDLNISLQTDGNIMIHTDESFKITPEILEENGYFQGVNSVLAGDATTGEIFYSYRDDMAYPIASTSKLMTYAVVMDAVAAGEITLEDRVMISSKVEELANSSDGVLPLKEGDEITVGELLIALLLPSSNESALALAEYVAGDGDTFVERMNRKAIDLGLNSAYFYNSNGLPSYTDSLVPAKRQNRMSAKDLFALTSYIFRIYPQITEITSLKTGALPSLKLEVNNTNPLLYNLKEVNGLKTGTTNKAGYCLVTSLELEAADGKHEVVVVLLGAEGTPDRGRVSELLARYAMDCFVNGTGESKENGEPAYSLNEVPTEAEEVVSLLVKGAAKLKKEKQNGE